MNFGYEGIIHPHFFALFPTLAMLFVRLCAREVEGLVMRRGLEWRRVVEAGVTRGKECLF